MRKVAMTALAKAYACTVCSLWEEEDAEELVRLGTPPLETCLRAWCSPPPCLRADFAVVVVAWLWLGSAAEC